MTEQEQIEIIIQHDPKEILRAMLPFIKWANGQSAVSSIRHALEPRWQDSIDLFLVARPRIDLLTKFSCTRNIHFPEQGWSVESDEDVDFLYL